eukprot:CAMPEP_0196193244 /NCGR_PEP_ID=MMETSP0911-20130528/49437_1 /TAXON_ID=49265 /ORGANISM="Thalassiosira rotula, Strain GSO102" /LENGTH=129 /DNA_ID=CAMNT_0041465467 /DNA_START=212 /DNA_END=601 /DNA_ORIENTATION=-
MTIPGEEDLTYVVSPDFRSSTEGEYSNPYAVPSSSSSSSSSEMENAIEEPSSSTTTTGIVDVDDPSPSSEENVIDNDSSNVGNDNGVATSSSPSLDSPPPLPVSPNKNCLGDPRQHCVAYAGCAPMFGK